MLRPAGLLGIGALLIPAVPLLRGQLELTSENPIEYDHDTQELRAPGEARLEYNGSLLTANEIIYNQGTRLASAEGDVAVTDPEVRLVGEKLQYQTTSRGVLGENIRFGRPPFFAEAVAVSGDAERIELERAIAYFGEPRPGAINLRARSVDYYPDERVEARGVTIHVGRVPVFYLPKVTRSLGAGLSTRATADAGYSRNLGGYLFVGTRTALTPGFAAGPEIGFFDRRGWLLGPGFDYRLAKENHSFDGSFRGGFIEDHGDRGADRLDRPIERDRFYAEWRHKQKVGEAVEITGVADVWSDSEVTRDFRPRHFSRNQFPDHFLEAVHLGEGHFFSAFSRVSPNDFEIVPERLPEIRFDLLPRPVGNSGIYQQSQISAAVLRENDPLGRNTRSDRLDWYFGLNRPFYLSDWLTFTPKAAARATHYQRGLEGRDDYTRVLGEIGADLEGNAFAVYDYRNELWQIDDIRHVVKPRIQYRYTPGADSGRRFIPQVDRQVFATHLEPIDLGQVRNIDELDEIHTLRYGIDNSFQTRHPAYGSTDLLSLYVANDLRFSRQPGQEFVSDIHTQLAFTPVYWFRFDALNRLSPQEPDVREMNTGLTITDARFWSFRFGTEYLQDRLEEYFTSYSLRLNETYSVAAEVRYDAVRHRFARQTYTLFQNLYDSWEVRYQVYLRTGAERESPAGFSVSLSYLAF